MRIAVANWSRRALGGVESYLSKVIPELGARGHEISLFSEMDEPSARERISLPSDAAEWCVARIGREAALQGLSEWRPDLVFSHVVHDVDTEAALLDLAPAVMLAHGYNGTCATGSRIWKRPDTQPCERALGWRCLVSHYPHRCGGLSPLTMIRDFRRNVSRRDLLPRYAAIAANSSYVGEEYRRAGGTSARVRVVPMPVHDGTRGAITPRAADPEDAVSLLFTGRMDSLKGGPVLLEALPRVAGILDRRVRLTLAGDGPERAVWEALARELTGGTDRLEVRFTGWAAGPRLDELRDAADLLVVPSLWPEPFGLVGPEAAHRGLPAAAFAVGGIPDWLHDGVSGYLAPADPPRAAGLADAIVRCVRDPATLERLRAGAMRVAEGFSMDAHMDALTEIFEAAGAPSGSPRLHPVL